MRDCNNGLETIHQIGAADRVATNKLNCSREAELDGVMFYVEVFRETVHIEDGLLHKKFIEPALIFRRLMLEARRC